MSITIMRVPPNLFKQLSGAFMGSFRDRDDLALFIRANIYENPEEILRASTTLQLAVYDLLAWSERTDRLDELVVAASKALPHNPQLKLMKKLLLDHRDAFRAAEALPPGTHAACAPSRLFPPPNAPAKPLHFVARPALYASLKADVGVEHAGSDLHSLPCAAIGICGMAGAGKTAMAAELVRDAEVLRHFDGRIAWLALGRAGANEILARMRQLSMNLGDAVISTIEDVQQGRTYLGRLMGRAPFLIVLDDVWELSQVEPFHNLTPNCRLLVTTRNTHVLRSLGAQPRNVGQLDPAEGLELLAKWTGVPAAALPEAAERVGVKCGWLPLALAVIGAMVRERPRGWEDALERLEKADLDKLKVKIPHYPYPDLLAAIQVSIEALNSLERDCYRNLAVLADTARVSEASLESFWAPEGLAPVDVRELAHRFVDLSLLFENSEGFSPHSLQLAYLRADCTDLPRLHQQLVNAYRYRVDGRWSRVVPDAYFYENFGHHLVQSDQAPELQSLLSDFDWLRAKLGATDVAALLGDFELVPMTEGLRLIRSSIRLSAHVLAHSKTEFASQLWGRLNPSDGQEVRRILSRAEQVQSDGWFQPLAPTLERPGGALVRTLWGHSGPVTGVAVSAHAEYLVSASCENAVQMWDMRGGQSPRPLQGHKNWVRCVAITPDGSQVVSGSDDMTVRLWDSRTGTCQQIFPGHESGVCSVAVTGDGTRVLSAGDDQTIRLWDVGTHTQLRLLDGHSDVVRSVAFTPDGTHAVSGSQDNTVRVWDLAGNSPTRCLEGHGGWVKSVAVSPDGTRIVSGATDGTVRVWDYAHGTNIHTLKHGEKVHAVAVTAKGTEVIAVGEDKIIYVWDLRDGRLLGTLPGHTHRVSTVCIASAEHQVVSGSDDRSIRIWDLSPMAARLTFARPIEPIQCIAITPSGACAIWAGDEDSGVHVSTSMGGAPHVGGSHVIASGHSNWVRALAVTPDGTRAVSGGEDCTVRLWETASAQNLVTLSGHGGGVYAVAISACGTRAVSGGEDGRVLVWDLASGSKIASLPNGVQGEQRGWAGGIRSIAITPDGSLAASGGGDGSVSLWDLGRSQRIVTFNQHSGAVKSLSITADGARVVSGGGDSTVHIWDVREGKTAHTLRGHRATVRTVVVTSNGEQVVSGSDDGTLIAWDFATGASVAKFTAGSPIVEATLMDDGTSVIVAEASGRIHTLKMRLPSNRS